MAPTMPLEIANQFGIEMKIKDIEMTSSYKIVDLFIRMKNKTSTPLNVLLDLSDEEVDGKYCPLGTEQFLKAKGVIEFEFRVVLERNQVPKFLLFSLARSCPHEIIARTKNHLKKEKDDKKNKNPLCDDLRQDKRKLEEIYSSCSEGKKDCPG